MRKLSSCAPCRLFTRRDTCEGTFAEGHVNAGGHATLIRKWLLRGGCVLQHQITRVGQDHLITLSSEIGLFMHANVHFRPNSTLGELRPRLHAIHAHWPVYPAGVGVLIGDLNICDPEEGRFCEASQTFSHGDQGRTATFGSVFPHALQNAHPNCTRKDVSIDCILCTLSRIDRAFIDIPVAEARFFQCRAQTVDDLGVDPHRVTILRSVSRFTNPPPARKIVMQFRNGSRSTPYFVLY